MNKFQKLAQLNRDIELLENAGKIKAADILHQKFIKEAQYPMPMGINPFVMNPYMYSMMARPQMPVARPAVAPVINPTPVAQPAPTPVAKPAPVPIGETARPSPVTPPPPPTTAPGASLSKPTPGNMQIAPMPKPTPTEQGTYGMEPGPGGTTVFTDPGNGLPTDPPGADQVFDHYYGKIQEAYRLAEPQRSQMLQNLYNQIKQRGDKLGGRLQGSLYNYINI